MTEYRVSDEVRAQAWDVIADARAEGLRHPNDVSTDEILDALIEAGLLVPTLDGDNAGGAR